MKTLHPFFLVSLLVMLFCISCTIPSTKKSLDSHEKVALLMEKGRYLEALDLMKEDGRGPQKHFEHDYVTALNKLLDKANQDLDSENYGTAGPAFKGALESLPADTALQQKVMLNQAQIAERLETCSAKLMEKGLLEYRAGDLRSAVKTWRKLVSFNPEYEGAKKSLNTAIVQMRALQEMKR